MKTISKFPSFIFALLAILIIAGLAAATILNEAKAAVPNTPNGINGYIAEQTKSDVMVTVKDVQTRKADVQVEMCIDMPNLEPWNPYATLIVDGTIIPNSGVDLINAKDPGVMKTTYRCYLFTFPFSTEGSLSGKGVIKLEKLWLELGRGQLIGETLTEVKNRVKKVAPGVDFELVNVSDEGGGGVYFKIISKSEEMSDADIMQLIQQMSIDELPTSWQTEITFK
jgi:hypothetical protein